MLCPAFRNRAFPSSRSHGPVSLALALALARLSTTQLPITDTTRAPVPSSSGPPCYCFHDSLDATSKRFIVSAISTDSLPSTRVHIVHLSGTPSVICLANGPYPISQCLFLFALCSRMICTRQNLLSDKSGSITQYKVQPYGCRTLRRHSNHLSLQDRSLLPPAGLSHSARLKPDSGHH